MGEYWSERELTKASDTELVDLVQQLAALTRNERVQDDFALMDRVTGRLSAVADEIIIRGEQLALFTVTDLDAYDSR